MTGGQAASSPIDCKQYEKQTKTKSLREVYLSGGFAFFLRAHTKAGLPV